MDITPKSVLTSSAKRLLIYHGDETFLNMKQGGLYCLLWEFQVETTLNSVKLKKLSITSYFFAMKSLSQFADFVTLFSIR